MGIFGKFFGKRKKRVIDLESDPRDILDQCRSDFKMSYSTCKTLLEKLKELKKTVPDAPSLPKPLSRGSRGTLLSMIDKVGFNIKQAESYGHPTKFTVADGNFLRVTCRPFEYVIARISDNEYLYGQSKHKETSTKEKVVETAATSVQETTPTIAAGEVERPGEGVGRVSTVIRSLKNAEQHFREKNYKSAMEDLLKVLSKFPHNRQALDLAQTILYICMSKTAEQKIPQIIIQDPLLDPVFAECSKCKAFWPVNPFLKDVAQAFVTNPVGGTCETCGRVFCRRCAIVDGVFLDCPQCHVRLGTIKTPPGRTRSLGKGRVGKKIVQVCVFKEAPEPPNMRSYVQLVLEALVPEALTTKNVGIYSETTRGEANQTYALIRTMMVKPELNIKKYDVMTETFTDRDGGRGIVLKVYEKEGS